MSNRIEAPIKDPIIGEDGGISMSWALFFNQLAIGDTGKDWNPTFINLTTAGGAPTITGRYYRLSRAMAYFRITIVPAAGGSTTGTAGSTYCDNFPLDVRGDSACSVVAGNVGTGNGMVVGLNNRVYPPAWSAVTIPLSIVGLVETQ